LGKQIFIFTGKNWIRTKPQIYLNMTEDARILKYEINPRTSDHFPLNWAIIFGRKAPLALEIGCGNGEFLVAWAKAKPSWNFVGIELSLASAERTQSRIFREKLTNVCIIRDDARFAVRELFADQSLQYIMVNFPDPWPKDKHRHRRLILPDFVDTVSSVLHMDGIIELVTDQQWYANDSQYYFEADNLFEVSEVESEFIRQVSTKYERKWQSLQRKNYRLSAVKKKSKAVNRIMEEKMPHIVVQKKIIPENINGLKGVVKKNSGFIYKILDVFRDLSDSAFLLRMVTSDSDYSQNFFILVAKYDQGFIVKIDPGYQPYRTPAVKAAIMDIGQYLESGKI
jgi:tRNA (guanine-N7-)-methyltransferase